jgi:hypothetical protein
MRIPCIRFVLFAAPALCLLGCSAGQSRWEYETKRISQTSLFEELKQKRLPAAEDYDKAIQTFLNAGL